MKHQSLASESLFLGMVLFDGLFLRMNGFLLGAWRSLVHQGTAKARNENLRRFRKETVTRLGGLGLQRCG